MASQPAGTTSTCCGFNHTSASFSTPPMSTAATARRYVVLSYAYWHSHFQGDPSVVGRVVGLNKHPFTIVGVAPPAFQGTLLFGSPEFYMPIVNQDQVSTEGLLNARGTDHGIFEVLGHLKPGVTPAQATADLNRVGAYLETTYPREVGHGTASLAHEGLTSFERPAEAFIAGLMLLAGLILLAACANLGSLFAAHAADRSREVALRLALGSSRRRILRQLLTEAMLISLVGGAAGLWVSVVLLSRLSKWQPFPGTSVHIPVSPDARLYLVALVLALISGFLFGIVPVRQVLRANPYEVVKAGSSGRLGRRMTVRDVLLVIQIAICAVLVTSSLVAVRGLARSLHGNYGFDPRNTMLAAANLSMAGYSMRQGARNAKADDRCNGNRFPESNSQGWSVTTHRWSSPPAPGRMSSRLKPPICEIRMLLPCHTGTKYLPDTSARPVPPCWPAGALAGMTTKTLRLLW